MNRNGLYLGIDFGTSTIYVTKWDATKKEAVPVVGITRQAQDRFIDNVIYYESSEDYVIGSLAFRRTFTDPLNVVSGIKRKLENDNWRQRIPSLGKELSAEEVVTDIFRFIKTRAEEIHGGQAIEGVVISLPFAFQSKERQKIKQAAEKAGLKVLALIEEPVAAAISFGLFNQVAENNQKEKILIFDLGGGTFDVTIFELMKQSNETIRVEVLNTDGDKNLGGKDIDNILVKKFEQSVDYEIALIAHPKQRKKDQFALIKEAKKLKENLSLAEEDDVFCASLDGGRVLDMDVTRPEFEQWLTGNGFIRKIREIVADSLEEIELEASDIDRIVLVGGSSHIPLIQAEIEQFFGQKAQSIQNPSKLVGEGAAIYCGSLLDKSLNYEIVTKISHAIGLKVGGKFRALIERNSKYETFSDIRYFRLNHQDTARIEIYQGNSPTIRNCSLVGTVQIDVSNLPGRQVGIQLGTDKNGIVRYQLYQLNDGIPFDGGVV